MKLSETLKKKLVLGLVATIPAIASGLISNCQARYEARQEAAAAERDAKTQAAEQAQAVIEGHKPAIVEIHKILTEGHLWAEDTDNELKELMDEVAYLKADVLYCKAYIQFDSRGRYNPEPDPTAIVSSEVPMTYEPPTPARPMAKLPDTVQKAQQYTKARKEQRCPPGDPLCGSAVL